MVFRAAVYDKMIEMKAVTPMMVINYANYLEEQKYYEESFKAYEKGISLFKFPIVFDVWVQYLTKFVERYGGKKLERTRELFEQVIEAAPAAEAKIFYIMYANLEEEFGLARRAMLVYDRATRAVADEDKFAVFSLYINRATEFFGVTKSREIYEKAIEVLKDKDAKSMCLRFAELEKRLGEIDRARAIYIHGSQFADARTEIVYWQRWRQFEVEHGNEDTFREMLRIKRTIQADASASVGALPEGMAGNFVAAGTLQPTRPAEISNNLESDMETLERLAQVQASLTEKPETTKRASKDEVEEEGEEGAEVEEPSVDFEQLSVPKEVFDRNVGKSTGKNEGALERLRKKRKVDG